MRSLFRFAACLLGLLYLAACARAPLETEGDQASRAFFTSVARGDWRGVDASLTPAAVATPGHLQGFAQAKGAIPGGPLEESRTVGWRRTERSGRKRLEAVHLYRYPGADLVVSTTLERTPPDNGYKVAGFYLNRVPPGVVEANRFSLADKTRRHYLFLLTAVLSPLVMLGMAAMAAFTPDLKLKFLWAALSFVGVGAAWMNWTTGVGGFVPAQIGLINFGFSRVTDISPWTIRFSAPVGALLVLARLLLHQPAKPAAK